MLDQLESDKKASGVRELAEELPLFSAHMATAAAAPAGPSPLEEAFADINPDDLTPRDALELLYRLRRLSDES